MSLQNQNFADWFETVFVSYITCHITTIIYPIWRRSVSARLDIGGLTANTDNNYIEQLLNHSANHCSRNNKRAIVSHGLR